MFFFSKDKSGAAPISQEVTRFLETFELFITQRKLNKPVTELHQTLHELRMQLIGIITKNFLTIPADDEAQFCRFFADELAKVCKEFPQTEADNDYYDYCIAEILLCFEWVQQIKQECTGDLITQKVLLQDLPILRPFDYGLRGQMRLVPVRAANERPE
jgi:hypothetical protein